MVIPSSTIGMQSRKRSNESQSPRTDNLTKWYDNRYNTATDVCKAHITVPISASSACAYSRSVRRSRRLSSDRHLWMANRSSTFDCWMEWRSRDAKFIRTWCGHILWKPCCAPWQRVRFIDQTCSQLAPAMYVHVCEVHLQAVVVLSQGLFGFCPRLFGLPCQSSGWQLFLRYLFNDELFSPAQLCRAYRQ